METLFPFFIILFSGLFLTEFFHRIHLPWVVALIISGFVVGPSGFGVIEPSQTLTFLAGLGLVFVMFMAGIETDFFSKSRESHFGKSFMMAFVGASLSWVLGYILATTLGLPLLASVLLGIIFISSSVAVAMPILEGSGIIHKELGKTILSTMIIQDVLSLVLFSVFSRVVSPDAGLNVLLVYSILIAAFFFLRKGIPLVRGYFVKEFHTDEQDIFEQELRAVLVLLVGIVAFFALLGIHEILAAFLAGMILTDLISHRDIKKNIHALGYGLFIPIFFASVGVTTQIDNINFGENGILLLFLSIIFGTLLIRYLSSYIAARSVHLPNRQAKVVAASMIPQLSTTLALGFAGKQMGLFDDTVVAALVLMSIISIFIAPLLLKFSLRHLGHLK